MPCYSFLTFNIFPSHLFHVTVYVLSAMFVPYPRTLPFYLLSIRHLINDRGISLPSF
ncbi:hypothetical protein HMPREF0208_01292 [Citrobacter koseri]|uniref:Uncharacterized protein n=1 Tax=Citrobacter koseri (strain ATCC BAA-895 / CDC 4225-83 / SGSC4696) TaxID=290338 RepID=A8ADM7_CITK8|nr:hypothetical protein CKO_00433 [Citrobacter koseri ATCC BAA-895]KXA00995.1 hypothetical protein HMPREF3220_01800 [Citrobacter koseri]KXB45548.1 hypothetical protein HMPREF0208_01292 [Citrobacter koseri]